MCESDTVKNVMVTGATGFVGRHVVRELLARGLRPVCVVRSPGKLARQLRDVPPDRWRALPGTLEDRDVLRQAAGLSDAAIHLVGIIIERRLRGQTFERVHARGTWHVVEAAGRAGIKRIIHLSSLGARPDARTAYHRTKWTAEEYVRQSGVEWTIFQPSLIHGPDGDFMKLMQQLSCGLLPPFVPYFGSGQAKLQPVSVDDVAHCVVDSLSRVETIGEIIPLGGPKAYTWIELYTTCRALLPKAKRWKPILPLPVAIAKLQALLSAPPLAFAELVVPSLGKYRFDRGNVQMSQEDNICDHRLAEEMFGISMRPFEKELAAYADRIG
ncbi:MAG: complex I NDUFA9 subunit family protein [Planctomycetes bacterium]|nr:complex I NDUFA9 subunit family protein [Planctomycetota bacterium]